MKLTVKITTRFKPWVRPAMKAAPIVCALLSFVSLRAAEWFGDRAVEFIVKRGLVFEVK